MNMATDIDDALDLLDTAWRVNRENLESFERRLNDLKALRFDLAQRRRTPDDVLDRAVALGFIAPLAAEAR